jgi:hypothetical protein
MKMYQAVVGSQQRLSQISVLSQPMVQLIQIVLQVEELGENEPLLI